MNPPTFIAPLKLGFLPASRGFFSKRLAREMRAQTLATLRHAGYEVIIPEPGQTSEGCVETRAEAQFCATLFREQRVDGVIVCAVNFGDEQAVALALRDMELKVPIFLFAAQEEAALRPGGERRDSFCGLLSIAEALRQIGLPYSIGRTPVCVPGDKAFSADLEWFAAVCRVVRGVRRARYGQIGARPDAFWTCRFDEKALQKIGPTTVTLDLSEVIGGAEKFNDDAPEVQAVLDSLPAYADTSALAPSVLVRIAKLEAFIRRWATEQELDALAVQCWTSIQQNYGVCACTTLSRLGDLGLPAACEADIPGALTMHALQLASGQAAALADWNNLHNSDPDLVNLWHCGVFPKSLGQRKPRLETHPILRDSGAVPAEKAGGIVEILLAEMPVTLARVTHDAGGNWKVLVAQGRIENNSAATGGSYGWCRINNLSGLYRDVLLRHFPHHVALTRGSVGIALREAFERYLGLAVFPHEL